MISRVRADIALPSHPKDTFKSDQSETPNARQTMASPRFHEAETLLPPTALNSLGSARSSVTDSLAAPSTSYGANRESQYSSVPLNHSYPPDTPSPRGTSPAPYQDDPNAERSYGFDKGYAEGSRTSGKRRLLWIIALIMLVVIAVAVIVPVYFKVIRVNNSAATQGQTSSAPNPTQSGKPGTPTQATITGGDGSKVTTETGSFTYKNSFGGFWYYDPANPFNNNAQAQSWTPPLNTSWRYGVDKIRGYVFPPWVDLQTVLIDHQQCGYRRMVGT